MPASQASTSSTGRAPRGSACLNCRRRKFKCDGARPICGPCIRTHREYDCEYTDGPTRSPTQLLEDNIARLETRIYELEHPDTTTPSVTLHDPRAADTQASEPSSIITLTPVAAPSTSSGLSTSVPSTSADTGIGQLPPVRQILPAPAPIAPLEAAFEPSLEVVQMLIGFFLPNAPQVGFFLHPGRLLQLAAIPQIDARQAHLSPALLNAIYLWGVHFSANDVLLVHEPYFLRRAVQSVSAALAAVPPYNILYSIQAEVLIAHYFFAANRFLEGRYHCNAAVALVLSCRLNKLSTGPGSGDRTMNVELPPSADAIEEGERINGFWAVYILDKSWAVTVGSPSHFNGAPDAQVDTPWPLDIEDYERGGVLQDVSSTRTMQAFLFDVSPGMAGGGASTVALRAKAAALFERATRLASQWTPTMAYVEQFATDYFVLDNIIDQFSAALPPVQANADDTARITLVTRTFARVATIQVHSALKQADGFAQGKDLDAARAAVADIESVNVAALTYVDPIMAILWTTVCRGLIGEISRLRFVWLSASLLGDQAAAGPQLQQVEVDHDGLLAALQTVLSAMSCFAQTCPLMAIQVAKLQQEIEAATAT